MSKRISTSFAETLKTVREGVTNGIDAFVRQRLKDAGNSDNADFDNDGNPIIDLKAANSLINLDRVDGDTSQPSRFQVSAIGLDDNDNDRLFFTCAGIIRDQEADEVCDTTEDWTMEDMVEIVSTDDLLYILETIESIPKETPCPTNPKSN